MAYFLGRDVDIAITTEHGTQGVVVKEHVSNDELIAAVMDWAQGSSVHNYATSDASYVFAGPRAMSQAAGTTENTAFGNLTGDGSILSAQTWDNQPNNLTALDVSLGVQDEDVAFIGQRNILKAEVKKENSLTITRKKSDAMWDAIYYDARFGVKKNNSMLAPTASVKYPGLFDGLSAPDFVTCGYRVVVRFNASATEDYDGLKTSTIAENWTSSKAADLTIASTAINVGDYVQVGKELLLVTVINAGTAGTSVTNIDATRGARGTTAASHSSGATSYVWPANVGEVLVFRNCYITEHNVTLQVDGTQEESMTLMSYTDPKIYDGIKGGEWDDATDATEL